LIGFVVIMISMCLTNR